jgi:hypothetical protein
VDIGRRHAADAAIAGDDIDGLIVPYVSKVALVFSLAEEPRHVSDLVETNSEVLVHDHYASLLNLFSQLYCKIPIEKKELFMRKLAPSFLGQMVQACVDCIYSDIKWTLRMRGQEEWLSHALACCKNFSRSQFEASNLLPLDKAAEAVESLLLEGVEDEAARKTMSDIAVIYFWNVRLAMVFLGAQDTNKVLYE